MSKEESLRVRMQNLQGKRVLVVGLARSGRAAADFLHRGGAVVTVSDSRPPWSFAAEIPELLSRKFGIEFGQHGAETFLRQDVIVTSPGVPWDLGALKGAREGGIPVVAEVEAASWFLKGSLVGVTGSNGKTTTTALIGRMLEEAGFPVFVGGNIGVPLISAVEQSSEESVSVAELSSFQLEGTESLHPQVAVVLNITPNHLDRHPSFEAYVEAKARILRNQTEDDYAVLNADDPAAAGLAERTRARKLFFSRTHELPEGLLVSEGKVVYRVRHLERELFSPQDVKLRGEFNLENVLAASAAACVLGAEFDALARAVREFRGVEHRLEHAGDVLGVEFYNDSKATSVDATVKALGAFEQGVHLILGGQDKGAPYTPLVPLVKSRVREVLLIGAAADRIRQELAGPLAGTVELVQAGDLETAVRRAFSKARPHDVILLSPACASFDQFHDFEDRGRKFKELVEQLAKEGQAARARRFWLEPPPSAPETRPRAASRAGGLDPRVAPALEEARTLLPADAAEAQAPEPSEETATSEASTEVAPEAQAPETQSSEAPVEAGAPANAAGIAPSDTYQHLTATRLALEEPATTWPQALARPERIYVYEVEADEYAPMDLAGEASIDEVIPDPGAEPKQQAGSSPGGALSDLCPQEPLMFEVPAGGQELSKKTALAGPAQSIGPAMSDSGEAGARDDPLGRGGDPQSDAATKPASKRDRARRGRRRAATPADEIEKQANGRKDDQEKLPRI